MTRRATKRDLVAADHLNSAAIHLLRGLRPVDERVGLTSARLSALSVLVFGGPRTLGELARAEDVRPPTMSGIVDGLERDGLARRTPHPGSARSVVVTATSAGEELMREAREARLAAIATALAELDPEALASIRAAAPHLRTLSAQVATIRTPNVRNQG